MPGNDRTFLDSGFSGLRETHFKFRGGFIMSGRIILSSLFRIKRLTKIFISNFEIKRFFDIVCKLWVIN